MEDIRSRLQTYFRTAHPERTALEISNLVTMTSGWESDVHKFRLEWGAPDERVREDLILRIYPGEDAYGKSAHEYHSLKLLWNTGYPVPRVNLLEREASPFGKPFIIMEQINGSGMWRPMFHSAPSEQKKLMTLFCGLFARLHALEWRTAVPDPTQWEPSGEHAIIARQLNRWQSLIATLPIPGFQANWEWLLEHQHEVKSQNASPVHWDFHPENLLLKDDGTAVVIDWTSFDITDYRFDLAWTLLLIGSNEDMRWREPVLREYEQQAGQLVTDLEFFDVAACIRRLVSVIVSVKFGPEKLGMRPGAEQIMRRQAPALSHVYELLLERTGLTIPEVEQFLEDV